MLMNNAEKSTELQEFYDLFPQAPGVFVIVMMVVGAYGLWKSLQPKSDYSDYDP
jgi:hypothetical protein